MGSPGAALGGDLGPPRGKSTTESSPRSQHAELDQPEAAVDRQDAGPLDRGQMLDLHDVAIGEHEAWPSERLELLQDRISSLEKRRSELLLRSMSAHAVEAERDALLHDRDRVHRALAEAERVATEVNQSLSWQLFVRLRARFRAACPPRSAPRRAVSAGLRLLEPRTPPDRSPPPVPQDDGFAPLALPSVRSPTVSIVVPVSNHAALTYECLVAILRNTWGVGYEVIVVDDGSTDSTPNMLARVAGVRVVRSAVSRGFVHGCNLGAAQARGEHLVFLNNDTLVRRGWLVALLSVALAGEDVGIVGAKVLSDDGSLQEAGCILWRDGSAWQYGRGEEACGPRFNFIREVDYCSGACLLVRRDLFERAQGFDSQFAPAYYEDVDLALTARRLGYRVVYQPKAEVVHADGASYGRAPGVKEAQMQRNRKLLVDKWGDILAAEQFEPEQTPILARERRRGPRALLIDHVVPMPNRDAGSVRMFALIEILLELGFLVSVWPDDLAPVEPYTSELQQLGVEVLHLPIDAGAYLREIGPQLDVCIVARPTIASRYVHLLREHAPQAPILFDTVDLHFLREQRRATIAGDGSIRAAADSLRELELAMTRASDATIVTSQAERDVLAREVPSATLHIVPMIHQVRSRCPGHADRRGLLFVAGFTHLPNPDAAVHLVNDIMPHVWADLAGVPLFLVGPEPPPVVRELESELVTVTGWVEDLDELLDGTRVMVAPLRFGAGLKGKITSSLAAGLPVVTTVIGAEGTGLTDGQNAMIADDPALFARRVVQLYDDEALWHRISEAGLRHAHEHFSHVAVRGTLEQILAAHNVGWRC